MIYFVAIILDGAIVSKKYYLNVAMIEIVAIKLDGAIVCNK